jgi:NADH dehydrogenase FAD-containing subunit
MAARDLTKLGVELHMGSLVTDADLHGVQVKDHDGNLTRYQAGTILWTAGVQAPPLAAAVAKAIGAQQDRAGRIIVEKDLTVPGHPDIFVTGDMMSLDKLPGVAEVAMQTGHYVGRCFLTGWRNRFGALFGWWYAFTRDLRRERGFTVDDMGMDAYSTLPGAAASLPKPREAGTPVPDPSVTRSRSD